jgi:hypothetical protein
MDLVSPERRAQLGKHRLIAAGGLQALRLIVVLLGRCQPCMTQDQMRVAHMDRVVDGNRHFDRKEAMRSKLPSGV